MRELDVLGLTDADDDNDGEPEEVVLKLSLAVPERDSLPDTLAEPEGVSEPNKELEVLSSAEILLVVEGEGEPEVLLLPVTALEGVSLAESDSLEESVFESA